MSEVRTILVAVDRSEQSDRAVVVTRDLAKATGGAVHLLHLKEHDVLVGKMGGGSFDRETDEEVESLLRKELSVLREAGLEVVADVRRVRVEDTAREILHVADEVAADVVVIGLHGPSVFSALMLGGTAYKVLHAAKRPVLAVP